MTTTSIKKLPSIVQTAKNPKAMSSIEQQIKDRATTHEIHCGDARVMRLNDESVHLVVTSPPYWTLKKFPKTEGQLGRIDDLELFLDELDKVWLECFSALVPGGRLICVVGDVCLSRRSSNGRHEVIPLHAAIQCRARAMGFDNVTPIIWHKIANATYETGGEGAFMGRPYQPGGIVKNDNEFILMFRKPGYRETSDEIRLLSTIAADDYKQWFRSVWTDINGESTSRHPAPYPVVLAERLIRMFSFVGDVILDPFAGDGSTAIAAAMCGRNSIGFEVDQGYTARARRRFSDVCGGWFSMAKMCGAT